LFDPLLNVLSLGVFLRRSAGPEKLPKLKISERFVLGYKIVEKSGPLERVRLANQTQRFRIPDRPAEIS